VQVSPEPTIPLATKDIRPEGMEIRADVACRAIAVGLHLRVLSADEALAQFLAAQEVAAVRVLEF